MTWESGSSDRQRLRAGYIVLSLGVFILLAAWVMYAIRGPHGLGEAAVRQQKLPPPDPDRVWPAVSAAMMMFGMMLFLILCACVYSLIRISRNVRDVVLRKPAKPTATSDVWKMHKIPELETGDPNPDDGLANEDPP